MHAQSYVLASMNLCADPIRMSIPTLARGVANSNARPRKRRTALNAWRGLSMRPTSRRGSCMRSR
eukprot:15369758-Alexandrium_andersonii.AAC.1